MFEQGRDSMSKISAILLLALGVFLGSQMFGMAQSPTGGYEKKNFNYSEWAKGRFSEVVTVKNPGRFLFLGGIGSEDENSATGGIILYPGDVGAQCRYAWDKIKRILEKQSATLNDVIKVTTYVTDIRYFADAGKCRGESFAGLAQPAGTFVAISQLAWPGMLIEVDVTATTAN
jgi:enamine deaminase RidA (YjgF/YER057c/UK114 family)